MDVANLQLALQQMKSKCERYEEQISRLQATLRSCEEELEQVRDDDQSKQDLLDKISSLQMEIVHLQDELEAARSENEETLFEGLEEESAISDESQQTTAILWHVLWRFLPELVLSAASVRSETPTSSCV